MKPQQLKNLFASIPLHGKSVKLAKHGQHTEEPRGKSELLGFMLIFLCALAALREIFFLKKDMDRLRSEFGDSNVIGALPFQH